MPDLQFSITVDPSEVVKLKSYSSGIAANLDEVRAKYPETSIGIKEERPKGSLGDANVLIYVIHHLEQIKDASQIVFYIVSASNILFQNVFRKKKEDTKKNDESIAEVPLIEEAKGVVNIGNKTYQLPLSSEEIEDIKKTFSR